MCHLRNGKYVLIGFLTIASLLRLQELLENYQLFTELENRLSSIGAVQQHSPGASICSPDALLQHSYEHTYKPLIELCSTTMKNETLDVCFHAFSQQISSTNESVWWLNQFLTIAPKPTTGLFGKWHELWSTDPDVRLCSIEKVATTQWRQVHLQFNNYSSLMRGWEIHDTSESRYALFLRDPLERFLSAYLDKCRSNARLEGHCSPKFIYDNKELDLLHQMSPKDHFESFVATMPFGWDLHFIPQAFSCQGLFRTLDKYDFIGSMDSTSFVRDLKRFQYIFRGTLADEVNQIFSLRNQTADFRSMLEEKKDRHFTNAPKQVRQYYSADTIRQVLKYVSVDYVALNLKIPDWAIEILTDDCKTNTS